MKLAGLEDVIEKAPFMPFDIHLDGKTIPVEHPDQVPFVFDRSAIVVAPRDNRFHIIEADQIQFLTVHGRRKTIK